MEVRRQRHRAEARHLPTSRWRTEIASSWAVGRRIPSSHFLTLASALYSLARQNHRGASPEGWRIDSDTLLWLPILSRCFLRSIASPAICTL